MQIDIFDPKPERVLVVHHYDQSLVAVVAGDGSWGSGEEVAARTRSLLENRWRDSRGWTIDSLVADVASATSSTPQELRNEDFGWGFSVTCLLYAGHDLVQGVAAGTYRVDLFGPAGKRQLFRPETLLDKLLSDGTLTPEQALTFEHQNVYLGPFVGDKDEVALERFQTRVAPDEVIVVTSDVRLDASSLSLSSCSSAREIALLGRSENLPSPVILLRPSSTM